MRSQLEIGQQVKLEVSRGEEYKENKFYETKVVDIRGDVVELDFSFVQGGKPSGIRQGKKLTLVFVGGNGLYRRPVKVKKFKRDPILSLEVVKKDDLNKIQRRRYVRVPVEEEIEYKPEASNFKRGLMVDVSGGGIKLKIKEIGNLEEGDRLILKLLPLSLSREVIEGKIVRIRENEDQDTGDIIYNLGIEFVDLSDDVREEIIEWGFVKQRELRRKGLI